MYFVIRIVRCDDYDLPYLAYAEHVGGATYTARGDTLQDAIKGACAAARDDMTRALAKDARRARDAAKVLPPEACSARRRP